MNSSLFVILVGSHLAPTDRPTPWPDAPEELERAQSAEYLRIETPGEGARRDIGQSPKHRRPGQSRIAAGLSSYILYDVPVTKPYRWEWEKFPASYGMAALRYTHGLPHLNFRLETPSGPGARIRAEEL